MVCWLIDWYLEVGVDKMLEMEAEVGRAADVC